MDEHHSWYNGSVWHTDWPYQVSIGQWPIFYGPAILLHILKTIWWRNVVLGIMDQYDNSNIELVKYTGVSDLYVMVYWFCLISLSYRLKFLYIKKWWWPGVFVPLWVLALVCFKSLDGLESNLQCVIITFYHGFYICCCPWSIVSGNNIDLRPQLEDHSGNERNLSHPW